MPNKKKIVVCLGSHPKSHLLIRAAAKKAREIGASWQVVYIEDTSHFSMEHEARERLLRLLTFAERLGAEICHIEAKNAYNALIDFIETAARSDEAIDHLIIGQTAKEGLFQELRPSIAERLMRYLRNFPIEVQIIPLTGKHYSANWFDRLRISDLKVSELLFSILSVCIVFFTTEFLRYSTSQFEWQANAYNVSAFFLAACILSSMRCGLIPGLITAGLSFLAISFAYSAPYYSFSVEQVGDTVSLVTFFLVAIAVVLIGGFSRASNTALVQKERRSQALYKIHRLASEAETRTAAFKILHKELSELLEMEVAFFLPSETNGDEIELVYPANIEFTEKERQSLKRCWEQVRTTGLGTLSGLSSSWRFEPLSTSNDEIGVIGINVPPHIKLDASFGRLLTALADQAASILERIELTNLMSESRMREEREKLRAMLLSSVSHDLKTPLASIIGSLSVYKRMQNSGRLNPEIATELTETALEEAQRLDSFISNILDMTRIESGDIRFDQEWIVSDEPVENVQKRLRHRLASHNLVILAPEEDHLVYMDQMMTEQVLQNILDNAVKYSPKGTDIILSYGEDQTGYSYQVRDHGSGIPDEKKSAIFDKYERLKQSDSQVAGTGLGLAIAKAIIEQQGGTITVANHPEGGAIFTIWLPKFSKVEKKGVV